ncbi:hypothetical protein ACFWOT_09115 [Streptomyces sp. NPDC058440]|uniref:hypothetical protein n=1 Tax=Streptomyces sp. NPDC058440 TaxID=3346501 RepID=UPI00365C8F90
MSLIKRFMDDMEEVGLKATKAAWLDESERFPALTTIFQECGERAKVYHDPKAVARLLVDRAVRDFRLERLVFTVEWVVTA